MARIDGARATLRLALQLAAVALVVSVPWVVHRLYVKDTLIAHDWVAHTAQVTTQVAQVASGLRDADRALLWLALYPDRSELLNQIDHARATIAAELAELTRLTLADPEQAARVEQLTMLLGTRAAESDRVLQFLATGELEHARVLLGHLSSMELLRVTFQELIVEEDRLMVIRREEAERRRQRYTWITTGFAVLQLILLALIVVWSERQHRRRLQSELHTREAREQSDLILKTMRKPIALLDRDLRILQCNPAFQSMYGGERSDLAGLPLHAVGDGAWSDPALLQQLNDVCLLGRELWDHETTQTTQAAGRRIMLVDARRSGAGDVQSTRVILTANDISAARSAERHIRELNEQLNQRLNEISAANSELQGFSYTVSHDLRAPLRHIAAFGQKLDRELVLPADSKAAHYLQVIGDSAQRMGVLIDELLMHSRLGRDQVRTVPVAMGQLVAEVRTMLETDARGRSIDWRVAALPTVSGDPSTLRLVWQNLLGNALKYTARRDRAVIEVDVRHDPERHEYVFRVADNGVGFDMAYADKLFGVFQRLHTAEEFAGTGIGLANARRVLARHGGRIWAEAEPDRGARFFFTLPDHPVVGLGVIAA